MPSCFEEKHSHSCSFDCYHLLSFSIRYIWWAQLTRIERLVSLIFQIYRHMHYPVSLSWWAAFKNQLNEGQCREIEPYPMRECLACSGFDLRIEDRWLFLYRLRWGSLLAGSLWYWTRGLKCLFIRYGVTLWVRSLALGVFVKESQFSFDKSLNSWLTIIHASHCWQRWKNYLSRHLSSLLTQCLSHPPL